MLSDLPSIAVLLGMVLTCILIFNGLMDMPVKIRKLWRMIRKWGAG